MCFAFRLKCFPDGELSSVPYIVSLLSPDHEYLKNAIALDLSNESIINDPHSTFSI